MTELKTLKDFWTILPIKQLAFSNKTDVTCHAIREEVIKHYKKEVSVEVHDEPKPAFEWIEEFFNLTEEDLKNE